MVSDASSDFMLSLALASSYTQLGNALSRSCSAAPHVVLQAAAMKMLYSAIFDSELHAPCAVSRKRSMMLWACASVQLVVDAVDAGVGAQMSREESRESFSLRVEVELMVQLGIESASCCMTETQSVAVQGGMMVISKSLTDEYSAHAEVAAAVEYASVISWFSSSVHTAACAT